MNKEEKSNVWEHAQRESKNVKSTLRRKPNALQRDGGEGDLRCERVSTQNIEREGDDRDEIRRCVPSSRRDHLPFHELAKHRDLSVPNP